MWPGGSEEVVGRSHQSDGHELIRTIVLIDRPAITAAVAQFLRGIGWNVHEASDCGQARGLITRFHPEFVIMELLLPLETGFEFCAYVKKSNCRIGVMILTEVSLDECRNLAMWAGADAYLVKPTTPDKLYNQLIRAAEHISRKIAEAESGMSGAISFRCKCGKPLKVGSKHAGKAIICPSCRHLAKCPESLLDAGTLFRTLVQERQGLQLNQAGIVCPQCRMTVDPGKCRVRSHYECPHCGTSLKISGDFVAQWNSMFADRPEPLPVQECDPLQYVYVQCESCRNLYRYFRTPDEPQPCPSCGAQHSLPSIRGVPVSRSALAATGRLFEIFTSDERSRLFLLPSKGRHKLGRSEDCSIRLNHPSVQPLHATLKNTKEGPMLHPGAASVDLRVNTKKVDEWPLLLHPGDEIELGAVRVLLHGTPERNLRRYLHELLTNLSEQSRLQGDLAFAEPGARLLQWHWELQRVAWVRQQTEATVTK
jgi:CheY-like chemotaxis protein